MWLAFRQAPEGEDVIPGQAPDILRGEREDPSYCCRVCGEVITRATDRIFVQGAHEHRFSNPAGFVFDIGCFRGAPGCLPAGQSSGFYSWFDGFAWRCAVCRACAAHLGWEFSPLPGSGRGGADPCSAGFFGLILNRLTRCARCPDGIAAGR